METKLKKIGNRLGIVLPQQLIDELNLEEGSVLTIEKNGSVLALRPEDSGFGEWAEAYRNANIEYKEVLKKLGND